MGKWITTALHDTMDGFGQNTTIEGGRQGICGNVAGNGVTGDVMPLSNHVGYHWILAELHQRRRCRKIAKNHKH